MADRLKATVLPSFYAAASREYDRAAEHAGVVERRLRFADRTVRLRFAGAGLAGTLFSAFAERSDDSTGPVHATVALWEAEGCPEGSVPFPWCWSDVGPGGLLRGPDSDRLLAVHETCSGAVTLIPSTEHPVLHRVPNSGTVPWWERAAPLRASLFFALGGRTRHLVHAAAVGNEGGAVLLVGARGSGKTTVAMAGLNNGLRFVADDYLLLNTAESLEAVSLYNTASIAAGPDGKDKTVLDLCSLMPGSLCESLPVRAVVVPRVRGGRAHLRRVSPVVALRAWAPTTVFQMPFDDGAVVASLADVVRRVPCFGLEVGDDETELAGAVVQVLEQAGL